MNELINMNIFSYHLVKLSFLSSFKMMLFPIKPHKTNGLIHAETMSAMILGSPIFSLSRIFSREIVVFAQWENEDKLNQFLETDKIGQKLAKGWHIRLDFLRQWGSISGFKIPGTEKETDAQNEPVVAVTLARMKYTEIPRFLRWGRPVEKLVRDHSGTTLSLASIRYPNTISTFSIWKTRKEMTDMVHGHSRMPQPTRHMDAMNERERKDFHFEFTTLRFRPIAEFGVLNSKSGFIPTPKIK